MLLVSGVLVITARNPVHGVLFLVLAFFTAAGIWLLLRAEFLAIALVVVYVGAVMVLFLFVVMMLDINLERVREGFWRNLPLALIVGGIMVLEMVAVLANRIFATRRASTVRARLQQHQGARPRALHPVRLSPSRSRRCCCWWRSSPPSRSPCAGARTAARRTRPPR